MRKLIRPILGHTEIIGSLKATLYKQMK